MSVSRGDNGVPENITFRNHLLGSISDFADKCQMGAIVKPCHPGRNYS